MTVAKLIPTACYLKPEQVAALKKLSEQTGAPVQHFVRLALDEFLAKKKPRR